MLNSSQTCHLIKNTFGFFILLSTSYTIKAQSTSVFMGARRAGMGEMSTVLSDEWALLNNVGTLAYNKEISIATAYEVIPSLPGSNRAAAVVSIPFGKGAAGMGFFRFGDEFYGEQLVFAGYSNRFGLAALGIKVSYIQYRAEGFDTKSLVSLSLGGLAEITPNFSIGAYATNINRPRLSSINDERLPSIFVIGVRFSPHKKLILATELEKDLEYKPTLKGGVEYKAFTKIYIRVGFRIEPNFICTGIGYRIKPLHISYAIQYNLKQVVQHQVSLCYLFRKPKKE